MQAACAHARSSGSPLPGLTGRAYQRIVGVLFTVVAMALLGAPAHAQAAQANWWEGISGYGTPDYGGKREAERERRREARKTAAPQDLRDDPTPWISDEMLIAMRKAIARYQKIVDVGGFPRVPEGRMMREGDEDDRVPILRRRLIMSGDLQSRNNYNTYTFDAQLAEAVRNFQRRHGLRPTGRIMRSAYPALNISAEERLALLRMNLGRIRELMSQRVENRYILVNIPAFQLEAVESFEVQQRHRVIVGRTQRQSPSLKATVRALNFYPHWHVPDSVAHLDLIPRLKKEPNYLVEEKIRVLTSFGGSEVDPNLVNWNSPEAQKLKFRQDPGPQNALGIVRIDMPNAENVYMHDTPMKNLFGQHSRAFSAGCVRVQNVLDLVDWIAKYEPAWGPGQAQATVAGGQPVDITLTRPVPVYFAYITAWAERDGEVQFRPDIYGRDGSVDMIAEMDRDPNAPLPPPSLAP